MSVVTIIIIETSIGNITRRKTNQARDKAKEMFSSSTTEKDNDSIATIFIRFKNLQA